MNKIMEKSKHVYSCKKSNWAFLHIKDLKKDLNCSAQLLKNVLNTMGNKDYTQAYIDEINSEYCILSIRDNIQISIDIYISILQKLVGPKNKFQHIKDMNVVLSLPFVIEFDENGFFTAFYIQN